jgi:hypothetical protein
VEETPSAVGHALHGAQFGSLDEGRRFGVIVLLAFVGEALPWADSGPVELRASVDMFRVGLPSLISISNAVLTG